MQQFWYPYHTSLRERLSKKGIKIGRHCSSSAKEFPTTAKKVSSEGLILQEKAAEFQQRMDESTVGPRAASGQAMWFELGGLCQRRERERREMRERLERLRADDGRQRALRPISIGAIG
jgi:hypothetical protein